MNNNPNNWETVTELEKTVTVSELNDTVTKEKKTSLRKGFVIGVGTVVGLQLAYKYRNNIISGGKFVVQKAAGFFKKDNTNKVK